MRLPEVLSDDKSKLVAGAGLTVLLAPAFLPLAARVTSVDPLLMPPLPLPPVLLMAPLPLSPVLLMLLLVSSVLVGLFMVLVGPFMVLVGPFMVLVGPFMVLPAQEHVLLAGPTQLMETPAYHLLDWASNCKQGRGQSADAC